MTAVPHLGFIVAAYLVTAAALGGTILALILDRRAQARILARFERPAGRAEAGEP